MKSVVIVLGAGAAKAWDAYLTPQLTSMILADATFQTRKKQPLARFVFDRLKSFYRSDYGINFETIINALESIHDYYINSTIIGGNPMFVNSRSEWFSPKDNVDEMMNFEFVENSSSNEGTGDIFNKGNGDRYQNYPRARAEAAYIGHAMKHYLQLIRSKIAQYSSGALREQSQELNNRLKDFFLYLSDQGFIPRIYTTNYDRLFPDIFNEDKQLNFFDGFDNVLNESGLGQRLGMNIPKILNDISCNTYYCLHGSIFWEYNADNKDIVYQFDCTPGRDHIMDYYNITEDTNPGEGTFVYNIVTGYNKLQRISIEPLNSFYSRFTKDCINAEMIITAGYSFSDFHINRPMKNAFRINDTKLLNIAFGDHTYSSSREFRYLQSDILRMKDDFRNGTETTEEWIKSKSKKQVIFLKGLKNFLLDKKWLESNL